MKFLPVVVAGLSGVLFSLGLGIAGMADPAKIIAFLDVAGDWDPALMFVMAGAMGSYALLRTLILRKRQAPVLAPAFPAATTTAIDRRLLGGAALFGLGWGLSGYCPGPAFTSIAAGSGTVLLFVASMGGGMLLFHLWSARATRVVDSSAGATVEATPAPATLTQR